MAKPTAQQLSTLQSQINRHPGVQAALRLPGTGGAMGSLSKRGVALHKTGLRTPKGYELDTNTGRLVKAWSPGRYAMAIGGTLAPGVSALVAPGLATAPLWQRMAVGAGLGAGLTPGGPKQRLLGAGFGAAAPALKTIGPAGGLGRVATNYGTRVGLRRARAFLQKKVGR